MEYKLETAIEDLIAFERVRMIHKSISEKSNKKVNDIAYGVYNRLAAKEKLPENSEVEAYIETENVEKKVRETEEAIKTFNEENPKAGARLKELIEESRKEKEIYLHFGHKENCFPTKEAYFRIFRNLGIKEDDLERTYCVTEDVLKKLRRNKICSMLDKHIGLDKK